MPSPESRFHQPPEAEAGELSSRERQILVYYQELIVFREVITALVQGQMRPAYRAALHHDESLTERQRNAQAQVFVQEINEKIRSIQQIIIRLKEHQDFISVTNKILGGSVSGYIEDWVVLAQNMLEPWYIAFRNFRQRLRSEVVESEQPMMTDEMLDIEAAAYITGMDVPCTLFAPEMSSEAKEVILKDYNKRRLLWNTTINKLALLLGSEEKTVVAYLRDRGGIRRARNILVRYQNVYEMTGENSIPLPDRAAFREIGFIPHLPVISPETAPNYLQAVADIVQKAVVLSKEVGDFLVAAETPEQATERLGPTFLFSLQSGHAIYANWHADAIKAGVSQEKINVLLKTEKAQEVQLQWLLKIINGESGLYLPFDQCIKRWQEVEVDLEVILKSGHPKIREKVRVQVLKYLLDQPFEHLVYGPSSFVQKVEFWKGYGIDVSDTILSPEIRNRIEWFLVRLKMRSWRRNEYADCFDVWVKAGWQPTEHMLVKESLLLDEEEREQDKQLHQNMQYFRSIQTKTKAGRDLSREDVVFLHGIPVFGGRADLVWRHADGSGSPDYILQQIKEFCAKRSIKEMQRDAAVFYECSVKEVAIDRKTINKKTKVYVGELFDGFFDKLSHVQHMYTSFPYAKVVRDTVVLNTPVTQIEAEFARLGVRLSPYAAKSLELLKKDDASVQLVGQEFTVVSVRASDFLPADQKNMPAVPNNQLPAWAKRFGLEPCPPLVGLQYFVGLFKVPGHPLMKNYLNLFADPSMKNSFHIVNEKTSFHSEEGSVYFDGVYLNEHKVPKDGAWTRDAQLVFLMPANSEKKQKKWQFWRSA